MLGPAQELVPLLMVLEGVDLAVDHIGLAYIGEDLVMIVARLLLAG
jgi:hypothetical protein